MKLAKFFLVAPLLPFLVALSSQASAQDAKGFSLDRFEPSERGSDWFALESLDLRGNGRFAAGVVADYGYKPLVMYNADGSERTAIIKDQLFTHVGASAVFLDRFRFALNVPILASQSGNSVANFSPKTGAAVGDVRLGADARLFGTYGSVFTTAFGVQVYLPTGNRDAFVSDGKARVTPRFTFASDIGIFTASAKLGANIRSSNDTVGVSPLGSEVTFGLAAGLRLLDKKLTVGPEIYGSTVVTDSDSFMKKRGTPFELIVGGHYQFLRDFRVGAGVGPGLSRGLGSPAFRGLLSLEWFPAYEEAPPPPKDTDHDGIFDPQDACPTEKGIATSDPRTTGCPPPPAPPADSDHDGIIDAEDACPAVAGVRTTDPQTNGCPPDRDGDGIIDAEDACPDVKGVKTTDPKTNGCPPPPSDRDKDTIIDSEDACPDSPGPRDPDPKKNGCPAARVERGQIRIVDQIKFDTAKATIRPESDAILQAVLKILKDHPEIKLVSIEGHTDNKGVAAANKTLSAQRAAAVVTWLTRNGIEKSRLTSAGFGQERPLDTNETDAGRQNNRRVEFHIRDPKQSDTTTVQEPPKK